MRCFIKSGGSTESDDLPMINSPGENENPSWTLLDIEFNSGNMCISKITKLYIYIYTKYTYIYIDIHNA